MNYYNEHDPKAAAWLRGLIEQGLIPAGEVDERSIEDVTPAELANFTQCHFFAGIGGWPLALQHAGWSPSKPIWTGSCPCQPFSQAGQGKGIADERHLWPAFKWHIEQRKPPVIIGEQVASADGREWLAGVRADLEDLGYAVGASDLCAAGVGAPHIRQRLYWVADNRSGRRQVASVNDCRGPSTHGIAKTGQFGGCRPSSWMGDTEREQHERGGGSGDVGRSTDQEQGEAQQRKRGGNADSDSGTDNNGLADLQGAEHAEQRAVPRWQQSGLANGSGLVLTDSDGCSKGSFATEAARHGNSALTTGFWSDFQLVLCRDGKTRRIAPESALFPLVDGLSYQLARRRSIIAPLIRGPGNAIVPQVAAEFVKAYLEAV